MKKIIYLITFALITIFTACKNENKNPETSTITKEEAKPIVEDKTAFYETKGMEIAFGTKKILGKNLMGTMKEKGALEALKFCNIKAMPLTDSMATVNKVSIKRVSDKTRNPNNKANVRELKSIQYFKELLANGGKITPIIDKKGEDVFFYYPIITNDMCLKCHGTPNQEISNEVLASLKNLYPTDMATGYSSNQVRGVWSIKF